LRVRADDVAEVRLAQAEDLVERQIVELDNAARRVAHSPYHSRDHGGGDLQAGRAVVQCERTRLFDRQARAVPVGAVGRSRKRHTERVAAALDVVLQHVPARLWLPVAAGELVQ